MPALPSPAVPGAPLALVCCGGTIAMHTDPDGLRRPAGATQLAEIVTELAGAPVRLVELDPVDSSQLRSHDWPALLAAVRTAQQGASAVLVTHGTDSLAWTSAVLAASGPWDVPVVLTAANVPLGEPGSDAITNLAAALAAARSLPAQVAAVFAGVPDTDAEVFAGGFFTKLHGEARAFVPRGHHIGYVDPHGRVVCESPWPSLDDRASRGRFDRRVRTVVSSPFLDPAALRAVGTGADAVVLELYACGTTSSAIVDGCRGLLEAGVEVWACPPSPLDATVYPSTGDLLDAGVTVRLDLTVELAAALLADRA